MTMVQSVWSFGYKMSGLERKGSMGEYDGDWRRRPIHPFPSVREIGPEETKKKGKRKKKRENKSMPSAVATLLLIRINSGQV